MDRKDLFTSARRLITLQENEDYRWLSPDQLLILRPIMVSEPSASQTKYTFHRFEISTEWETPLETFNQRYDQEFSSRNTKVITTTRPGGWWYQKRKVSLTPNPPAVALSPDGQWLLWRRPTEGYRLFRPYPMTEWRAASTDGRQQVDWPPTRHSGMWGWLPDSRLWLETIYSLGKRLEMSFWQRSRAHHLNIPVLRLRRLNDPEYERIITVTGLGDGLTVGITARQSLLMRHLDVSNMKYTRIRFGFIGVSSARVIEPGKNTLLKSAAFSEVDLRHHRVDALHFELPLPEPGNVRDVLVSPDGSRLGWITEHSREYYAFGPHCLWTSDLEGGDVREIGWVEWPTEPYNKDSSGGLYAFPCNLKWSSDSQFLSFTYGDDIYAVPVAGT